MVLAQPNVTAPHLNSTLTGRLESTYTGHCKSRFVCRNWAGSRPSLATRVGPLSALSGRQH